jgi:hypothetical protein
MKDAIEAIDRLFSNLGNLLRYFAPGFAALFVVAAVFPGSGLYPYPESLGVTVLGMLLGIIIYSFHALVLVRLAWFPLTIYLCKRCKKFTKGNHKNKRVWATMLLLDEQRWLRRVNKGEECAEIQKQMDNWAAMLNFLYCLSYTMILIPIVDVIDKFSSTCWFINSYRYRNIILFVGVVVLFGALFSEFLITKREIRLTDQYRMRPNSRKTSFDAKKVFTTPGN